MGYRQYRYINPTNKMESGSKVGNLQISARMRDLLLFLQRRRLRRQDTGGQPILWTTIVCARLEVRTIVYKCPHRKYQNCSVSRRIT